MNKPIVCYVTDRKMLGGGDAAETLLEKIRMAMTAGADWVQIREKDLPVRELLELARQAVGSGPARVIINDRLDIALAAGAAGVHLSGESLPVSEVARWRREAGAPGEFLIGASCHSVEEARAAEGAGASYAIFGPVFETPSKRAFGAPQGVARLAEACRSVSIPVIAIGGVDEKNGVECIRTGAAGVAAIRMFQQSVDAAALQAAIAQLHGCGRRSG